MKIEKILFYYSNNTDPFVNLAIEDKFLKTVLPGQKILLMYQNSPSIVMGRFQNPWLEADINSIQKDGVKLARRQSGGGCVYHDEGNLNFCFIQGERDHHKDQNNEILVNAIKSFSIEAYASGRSDLMIDIDGPKKISGSAFKQKKDSSFHHGTMLIKSDLDRLTNYLMSKHEDIVGKGIKSVKSKVLNLSALNNELNQESFVSAVKESFSSFYSLNLTEIQTVSYEQSYVESLKNWKWLFGETPKFKISRDFAIFEIHKGVILKAEINQEKFHPSLSQEISQILVGLELRHESIAGSLDVLLEKYQMSEIEDLTEDILKLFCLN